MQLVHNQTYQAISLPIVATLWCIAVTNALIAGQFYAERHYARGLRPRTAAHTSAETRARLAALRGQGDRTRRPPDGRRRLRRHSQLRSPYFLSIY